MSQQSSLGGGRKEESRWEDWVIGERGEVDSWEEPYLAADRAQHLPQEGSYSALLKRKMSLSIKDAKYDVPQSSLRWKLHNREIGERQT